MFFALGVFGILGMGLLALSLFFALMVVLLRDLSDTDTAKSKAGGWAGFVLYGASLGLFFRLFTLTSMGVRTGAQAALDIGVACAILTIPCSVLFQGEGRWVLWCASGFSCLIWLFCVMA